MGQKVSILRSNARGKDRGSTNGAVTLANGTLVSKGIWSERDGESVALAPVVKFKVVESRD